eukprot:2887189-Pleurochrysis_carterae.AAC.1
MVSPRSQSTQTKWKRQISHGQQMQALPIHTRIPRSPAHLQQAQRTPPPRPEIPESDRHGS